MILITITYTIDMPPRNNPLHMLVLHHEVWVNAIFAFKAIHPLVEHVHRHHHHALTAAVARGEGGHVLKEILRDLAGEGEPVFDSRKRDLKVLNRLQSTENMGYATLV